MKIQINNKHTIDFKNDLDGDWYGEIFLNNINFEFSFYNQESIDWNEIKNRIEYFEKHCPTIIEITNKGVKGYLSSLGWELNLEYDIECIEIPLQKNRKDDFILMPNFYDDPYVVWTAHIFDKNGPTLRKVLRE